MSSLVQKASILKVRNRVALQTSRAGMLEFLGVFAVVIIAALLRFTNLDALGYANHYYTAGVKSMLQSWHNFFYAAAEPGASVTIDKPPVGLWFQVISAYFLGVSGFSVLLPELLAGIISVVLIYFLVRRSLGIIPGLLAALALAITPVVVATDRNNTIDSILILTLLLATWAFIKATETGRLRYLMLGALLVGIGFNIKMLQAYLPLPAFYAVYFLGSSETIKQKAGKLFLASVLLVTVSLSWAVAVDLTPASQRPYVGSSSDNSETNLILVYNGVDRLLGMFGRRGNSPRAGFAPPPPGQVPAQRQGNFLRNFPYGNIENFSPQTRFNRGNSALPPGSFYGFNGNGQRSNNRTGNNAVPFFRNGGGGGGLNTGRPSPLRLFVPPLSKEVSWLLLFGIAGAALIAASSRLQWPLAPNHQALVLWGGWLVTCMIFFSIAGFFHPYYLSMLAPPLAALVAIGIYQLWNLTKSHPWLAYGILGASVAATAAFQIYTALNFVRTVWWLPGMIALFVIGLAVLTYAMIIQTRDYRFTLGFGLIVATMFITPGVWSVLTNLSASQNQSLPAAYSGGRIGPVEQRGLQINQQLLDFLQANTKNITYLMAVPSSMQGADYVLATGRPVLYMGGFMGQDNVVTSADLSRMVSDGTLRYIYWNSMGRGSLGANSEISLWIASACTPVEGFDTTTQNAGAPDGTGAATGSGGTSAKTNNSFFQGGPQGNMLVSLYDCASH